MDDVKEGPLRLTVDVGNTETVIGIFRGEGSNPERHWRVSTVVPRTPDEFALLLGALLREGEWSLSGVRQAVVGSVVPSVTEVLRSILVERVEEVVMVDADLSLPIHLQVEEPRTVGADRIVNTLAAKVLFDRDTVVVDLGTATTFDCISAEGEFLGGVISPGIQSGLEWLGKRTAKLPRVELLPPRQVVGKRTETCIQSGVFYSAVAAIDGIIERIREEWDRPEVLVVTTGGYAPILAPHCRTVDRVEPLLTLRGLSLAGRHVAEERG